KDAEKAPLAAEAMAITSPQLKEHGLIDDIIPEPLGGGHRDLDAIARNLKAALIKAIDEVREVSLDRLLEVRYERLMSYGVVAG
ncbi:MAG: acetyl-CoA carboxylase carboxyl transferase subunit alpha, partial [Thiohalocapsa sp.]